MGRALARPIFLSVENFAASVYVEVSFGEATQ